MRKSYVLIFTVIITANFFLPLQISAQAPQKMSYQAVIRNANNNLVASTSVGMRVSILQGSVSSTSVYVETQTPTTNSNGLITLEIGGGTVVSGTFSAIDWSSGPYFIKTEIDPTGGTNYTITGTSQLLSVPYALYAGKSSNKLSVSGSGDTLFLSGSNFVLVPGISAANPPTGQNTVTDKDNNVYQTITIGTQLWMLSNLQTTKYSDGSSIPLATTNANWSSLSSGSYCWMNNDSLTYHTPYGALYNWYAVNTGNLCPTGWHVPSNADWTTLFAFLGNAVAGTKLKESGTAHWTSPNNDADNSSGFTGLPGGYRFETGGFYGTGGLGDYWSATQYDSVSGNFIQLYNGNAGVGISSYNKKAGFSVRCVKN